MSSRPISEVLADNLRHYMSKRGLTQAGLAELSKVGQTTIGLYLSPERRQPSKSGKLPSPNLGDVERLAQSLEVEVWDLLRPMTPVERDAYQQIEAAFKALKLEAGAPKGKFKYEKQNQEPVLGPKDLALEDQHGNADGKES